MTSSMKAAVVVTSLLIGTVAAMMGAVAQPKSCWGPGGLPTTCPNTQPPTKICPHGKTCPR